MGGWVGGWMGLSSLPGGHAFSFFSFTHPPTHPPTHPLTRWIPDDVVFVEAIPLGATGKVLKTELRARFKGHVLPSVAEGK